MGKLSSTLLELDIDYMLKWGAELSQETAHTFFPHLDIQKYKKGVEPEQATFDITAQELDDYLNFSPDNEEQLVN